MWLVLIQLGSYINLANLLGSNSVWECRLGWPHAGQCFYGFKHGFVLVLQSEREKVREKPNP